MPDDQEVPQAGRSLYTDVRFLAMAAAVAALVLYLFTLNPTFGFIDKGELVAAAATLGIPHPTGYPTIMMLGWLFALVVPGRAVLALNVMAAILAASGVGVLTMVMRELLTSVSFGRAGRAQRGKRDKRTTSASHLADEPALAIIAACCALFVGLTTTWWNQANGFEVYSLHALLMPLSMFLFLRYTRNVVLAEADSDRGYRKIHFFFPFVLGLAFTNHLTEVLLAPALLVYFFWAVARSPRVRSGESLVAFSARELARLVPGFIVGLLPYLYLPIRASAHPLLNWGDPETLKRFVDHVTGKQYSIWMNTADVFQQQSAFFFGKLPSEVAYIGIVLALAGVVWISMRSLVTSAMVVLLFVVCVFWAGRYDILEIEPYFMTAMLAVGIWCAFGLRYLLEIAGRRAATFAAVALTIATAVFNFNRADETTNTVVEDMTVNMLTNMPPNALIISQQWDFWLSGSWYMQAVEHMRPDVAVFDNELLRRSWYLDQMKRWHPDIMAHASAAVERFRQQVYLFEHDLPYDPAEIQTAYVGMINAIIDSSIGTRPVFVTGEIAPEIGAKYARTPNYLALRLMTDSSYLPQKYPSYQFQFWKGRVDHYAARAYELYARSSYARALYEGQFGNDSLARLYYEQALSFDPVYQRDEVPDQSLNGEDQTIQTIDFFEQLRKGKRW